VKSKNILWKYLLLEIKYIFLRDSYFCPTWIFICDSDQALINSEVSFPSPDVIYRFHSSLMSLPGRYLPIPLQSLKGTQA
jgi:hypothetical protein